MPDTVPNTAAQLFEGITQREVLKNLALTALLWGGAFGARFLVLSALRRRGLSPEQQRRFVAGTRTAVLIVLVVGTAALWIDELKIFALSLVAVAAAIVVATKELIMCVGGTFLRTSARSYEIGDRIDIGGVRGDVIDTSLFTTTVLEIGPGTVGHQRTGRTVTLPNALLFTHPVSNESVADPFVLHTFSVVVARDERWVDAEQALLDAARAESADYASAAREFFERASRERHLDVPSLEPRVLIQLDAPGTLKLICRLPTPARRKGSIEQAIVRRTLSALLPARTPTSSTTTPATPPRAPAL